MHCTQHLIRLHTIPDAHIIETAVILTNAQFLSMCEYDSRLKTYLYLKLTFSQDILFLNCRCVGLGLSGVLLQTQVS